MPDVPRPSVVVFAPAQLVVANRTAMKSFLLSQLAMRADVILDVSDTTSIDSSALGMLVSVERAFRSVPRALVICGLTGGMPELFAVTQVERRIRIGQDIAHARRLLSLPPLPETADTVHDSQLQQQQR